MSLQLRRALSYYAQPICSPGSRELELNLLHVNRTARLGSTSRPWYKCTLAELVAMAMAKPHGLLLSICSHDNCALSGVVNQKITLSYIHITKSIRVTQLWRGHCWPAFRQLHRPLSHNHQHTNKELMSSESRKNLVHVEGKQVKA